MITINEEFHRCREHSPAESQVSAFASTLGEAEAMLKETLGQIRQLVQPEGDRPEQEEVSASSSAHDETQGAEKELEESEMLKSLDVFKGRIKSFVGDMKTFCELLRILKYHQNVI
jgi:hypothetical protein